jgi:hypothetical protein
MAQIPFNELDRISLDRLAQNLACRLDIEPFSAERIIGDYIRHWLDRPAEAPLAWYHMAGWPAFDPISLDKACAKAVANRLPSELMGGQIFMHLRRVLFFDRRGVEEFYRGLGIVIEAKRSPTRRASRSHDAADQKLFREMDDAINSGKAADSTAAARLIGERIPGAGTLENRIERLARKHRHRVSPTATD